MVSHSDITPQFNPRSASLAVIAFVRARLQIQAPNVVASIEEALRQIPEVTDCCLVAGCVDFLLRVVVADIETYERLPGDCIRSRPSVPSTPPSGSQW